jgi:hypothetical protein
MLESYPSIDVAEAFLRVAYHLPREARVLEQRVAALEAVLQRCGRGEYGCSTHAQVDAVERVLRGSDA